jgi:MFS family permease
MWRAVLRGRAFRRLWVATTIDSFGSWLLVMAVPLHVYSLTGSATSTGLALAVQALPFVLVGPWAGVTVDRWHRKTVIVAANLAAAAGVAMMALATRPDRAAFIHLGLVVEHVALCFLRPALAAVTPEVVGRGADLAAANALSAFTNSAFRMLGPLAGTLLVAGGWFGAVVLIDVASYLVAAAVLTGVATGSTGSAARRAPRIMDGLRHVTGTPVLRGLLLSSWAYWTANAALTALLVPFVAGRLHGSGQALGYLIAGLGAGYLCGSALSGHLIARWATRTVLTVAYSSVGLCFLVMFTATTLPVALVAVTAGGVPGAVAQVATGHRVQASTPDSVLGRVSAAFHTSDAVAAVTGALAAPAVVALAGLGTALRLLSAAVLGAAMIAWVALPTAVGDGDAGAR